MARSPKTIDEPLWLVESRKTFRDLFIELDTILKAIDRFFNVENLPIEAESLSDKNFYHELIVVRDSILRALSILEVVLPENRKNAYWLSKFAEAKFFTDWKRDSLKEKLYSADNPEKFIFLLYDALVNFKGIVSDVLKSRQISYLSFKNIGDIISKEIRENSYLNPFKNEINSEYDRIENQQISDIVKDIKDRKLKRSISMSFLFLFRLLRHLNCIDITTKRNISISCGLLILMLLKSEIRVTLRFFETELAKPHFEQYRDVFQPIIFQITMEQKRVYNQELKNILQMKNILNLRGKIENSHGILKNVIEQCIVQIAGIFNLSMTGEDIFSSFITRMGQSMKLREDIFILHKILSILERNLDNREKRASLFESLKNFMMYFESFTFKLLRHDDYEEFVKFFNEFLTDVRINALSTPDVGKLSDKIHNFKIFLDTTLSHINNRTELRDNPIDIEKTELLLRQYIQ
jgi:hypothetical protein